MIFKFNNRYYRLIPFLIHVIILFFVFCLIVNATYKYHSETEERRLLLQTDIRKEAIVLNDKIRMEN
ncbi:MAG: hypothetical protein ACQBVK_04745 [Candidatus Phytoplasma sp. TWB_XP]